MSSTWAITAYYNPSRGVLRRRNYDVFRRRLEAPLLTVEWSADGHFEIAEGDADILVRVSGGGCLWQKEALLNVALSRVPAHCRFVAWLDCDVVFDRPGWSRTAERLAEHCDLVQLFESARDLPADAAASGGLDDFPAAEPPGGRDSLLKAYAAVGRMFTPADARGSAPAPSGKVGMGYLARREFLEEVRFYDANVVGGGDLVLVAALLGRLDELFACRGFSAPHRAHVEHWASGLRSALGGRVPRVGWVPATVGHLWHGDKRMRRYTERYRILEENRFDPRTDLVREGSGLWNWRDPDGAIATEVARYLASRMDG